jgi:hypothetical protein
MAYQIFICYRWADTAGVAGRLYDVLEKEYGEGNVFFDVERDGGAERLDDLVVKAVRNSAVVLVLIGQRWFVALDQSDQPRLLLENDVVRIEIETALANAVPVIPILVEGGKIPQPNELPPKVRPLTGITGFELNNRFWKAGLDRLLPAIEATLVSRSQLTILERGREAWDRWRAENPKLRPRLVGAELPERSLAGFNLSECDLMAANLRKCDLTGSSLVNADLSETNLEGALLVNGDLTGVVLRNANVIGANLSGARVQGADLTNANLNDVEFGGSLLEDCRVWGVSAWGARFTEAKQGNLGIGRDNSVGVTVDDIAFASLFSLLQDSSQFRGLIDALTQKCVLVLGSFTPERIHVLRAIEGRLRELGFVPILFDFQRPSQRSFTDVLRSLAGLSRFIVAEISMPRSVAHEIQTIAPYLEIPLVPLLQEGEEPFRALFDLIEDYRWVLTPLRYGSLEELVQAFETAVVTPALDKAKEIASWNSKPLRVSDYRPQSV